MYYLKRLHIALFRLIVILLENSWKLFIWILVTLANLWVDQLLWLDKYLTPDAWKTHRKNYVVKEKPKDNGYQYETDCLFIKREHRKVSTNEQGKHVKVKYV
jgi:hypothetical protein